MLDKVAAYSHSGGLPGLATRFVLRFIQFVLAITVAGLYGVDLSRGTREHVAPDGRWVYAEIVAGLSAVSVIVYAIPMVKSYWFFAWDIILL